MSASPVWKVYDGNGVYQASCKELEAAASLMSFYGEGATIRFSHGAPLWREGEEDQTAWESYDHVVTTVLERLNRGENETPAQKARTASRRERFKIAGGPLPEPPSAQTFRSARIRRRLTTGEE